MNLREVHDTNDSVLIGWITENLKRERKEFTKCKDEGQREDHLVLISKGLRELVNATRTKQAGIQQKWKKPVYEWIQWLQKELLKREYSTKNTSILKSIQYGIRHCGNLAIEGTAINKPVSAADRKRLAHLQREADKRASSSLQKLVSQDIDGDPNDSGTGL